MIKGFNPKLIFIDNVDEIERNWKEPNFGLIEISEYLGRVDLLFPDKIFNMEKKSEVDDDLFLIMASTTIYNSPIEFIEKVMNVVESGSNLYLYSISQIKSLNSVTFDPIFKYKIVYAIK